MSQRRRTVRRHAVAAATASAAPATRPAGPDRVGLVVGATVTLAVLVLYARTAARDIVLGDSPELTGAAIALGVAHPPGYPVWTMLGHLFTLMPLGPLPFRVALLSAIAGAACTGVVFAIARRASGSVWAAAASALALALSPSVWTWSIVPEVFALNDLLAGLVILFVWCWHEAPERGWLLAAAALAGGLGMANQQTIVLIAPACLYLLWRRREVLRRRPCIFIAATAAFAAGLLPYAYLPWAASMRPAWSWGDISSVGDLVDHVLRRGYGTTSLLGTSRFAGGTPQTQLALLGSFTPVELILIALGAWRGYRSARPFLSFALIAFAFAGPAFLLVSNVSVADEFARTILQRFFLLSHVVLAPLAALGIVLVAEALTGALRRQQAVAVSAGLATFAAIAIGALSFAGIDASTDRTARTYAEDLLASTPSGSLLLASGDPVVFPLGYLLTTEHARPDVTLAILPLMRAEWYARQLGRDHPDLVLRYASYAGPPATMRALVEPNLARGVTVKAELLDDSTASTLWVYHHGLVGLLRPLTEAADLKLFVADNAALLAAYRPPPPSHAADRPWEHLVLLDYGFVAYNVGHEYELAKQGTEARAWYERALAIAPDLAEAKTGLARLR